MITLSIGYCTLFIAAIISTILSDDDYAFDTSNDVYGKILAYGFLLIFLLMAIVNIGLIVELRAKVRQGNY